MINRVNEETVMMDMKQLRENISKKLNHAGEEISDTEVSDLTQEKPASGRRSAPVKTSNPPMAIGATIHIKGDVTGDEDLIIHGHVEGQINLKDYNVIIGPKGSVQANIQAKQIVVEGDLNGDLKGEEKVIIRKTGNVLGNVISPRVTLEDGAMFKGSIEMEPRENHSRDKNTTNKLDTSTSKTNVL